jgi:phosphotransferase system HPr-like phosphotransfer protein
MDLMLLAACQGTELTLEANGADALRAADAIERFFMEELSDVEATPTNP